MPRAGMLDPAKQEYKPKKSGALMLTLDHLVIGCTDLESGAAWLADRLGAPPGGAGRHERFSTHNKLWALGPAYLELIAIDPDAPDPGRPRWFALDDPATQTRLREGPKLLTWVVRSDDLHADLARSPRNPGTPLELARDDLAWTLTVLEDGGLIGNGAYPHLIRWAAGVTPPPETLPDQELRLSAFGISGPKTLLEDLTALCVAHLCRLKTAAEPALRITIARADGAEITIKS